MPNIAIWHGFRNIYQAPKQRNIMDAEKLLKRISELESLNDQLLAELRFLDGLLRQIGFEEGLKTLKSAAQELLEQDNIDREEL